MTVANDEAVAVHVRGQHGVQLGLRAGLQSEVIAFAVADDLLHDGSHLVHLHGEDDEMLGLVVVLLGSLAETLVGLLDAVVEDVGEAQQHRSRDMAGRQLIDDLLQVHLHVVLLRRHIDVSLIVDAKIAHAPPFDVVELFGIFNAPFLHIL